MNPHREGQALGAMIRAFDWGRTSLGPMAGWPQSLKTTVKLVTHADTAMCLLWGRDGVMLYNDAYAVIAGDRHPAILGGKATDAWPHLADFNRHVIDTVMGGQTLSYIDQPFMLQRPSGPSDQTWLTLNYSPLFDDQGEVAGVLALVTETTATVLARHGQLVAQQAMRSSDARFEAFAQAMPNHVWSSPPDGQLDWFNQRVYEYSGAGPGELDGAGWGAIVHPDDVPHAVQQWGAALASGQAYETEFRLRRADGQYRWHIARAVPIHDEQGALTRWIGTNTDIEDQKKIAQALSHLNATLAQQVAERTADRDRMWRLSTDVMLVADFKATITALNPAWHTLLGWEEHELLGQSFMNLVHPDDQASTLAEVGKLGQGATTFKFTNRYRRKDGSYCVLAWTAVPDEQFIHGVGRDVSAETEAAQALAQTEEALRQSQKMEAVGQLTGGIAHDFNNMLAVVIGSLDLLKRRIGVEDARARRHLDAATDGAKRAALLTQRLLAFARQQPLQPLAVELNKLVANMSDLLRHSLGADVRLETVLAGGLWRTHVDPNQLENVILNLAVNARDAMPEGGRLTIETQNAYLDERYVANELGVAAGQYVLIAVTDDGAGMPPDVVAKAFDPFFTTKEVGRGTGLGLSQVYGFIKQSNGHVKIYSEVGQGTTIKVYLPRLTGEAAMDATTDEHRDLPLGDELEVVLVVEDEPAVRQFSIDALRELGYRVLEADGANAALRLLQSHPEIALLFTDIVMPDINGRKLADEARRQRPDLKVLFTTGYTRNAVVHNGVLDPGVALIGKPFGLEELAAKVREVLDDLPNTIGHP